MSNIPRRFSVPSLLSLDKTRDRQNYDCRVQNVVFFFLISPETSVLLLPSNKRTETTAVVDPHGRKVEIQFR